MPKSLLKQSTTAQSFGALLKSARDIMRKDKSLNGDLDRLPMLTWIMFLKFLDDLEILRGGEVILAGKKFKPAIDPPYRWRYWPAQSYGPSSVASEQRPDITGDELLAFINNEETTRAVTQEEPDCSTTTSASLPALTRPALLTLATSSPPNSKPYRAGLVRSSTA